MLRTALARKRAAMLRPDSCWSSVRVVFLSDDLLDRVNDERGYPGPRRGPAAAPRQAVYGRRTVRVFLRGLPGRASWTIYDSPYFPPLIGTLFEMPDGRRIVQLLIRRRQRSPSDHLYLQLDDTRGHYFSAVFDEIVDNSVDDNKVVPAGLSSIGERFRVTSTRYRRNVLVDGSGAKGWLPMVLVITWRMRDGQAEPLLQLRTQRERDPRARPAHPPGRPHHAGRAGRRPGWSLGWKTSSRWPPQRSRVQMETGESRAG